MDAIAILAQARDTLIDRFGAKENEPEVRLAREAYAQARGRVFEDDEAWEHVTRAFLEWLVAERHWGDTGKCPALLAAAGCGDSDVKEAMEALASSQRSLAEICTVESSKVTVRDLVGGALFEVCEERSLVGLQIGDIVEVRLIGFREHVLFGRTFIFHPRMAAAAIETQVAKMQSADQGRGAILDHMAKLRVQSRSYKHVSPVRIYEGLVL